MSDFKRYKLNPETLLYEIKEVSRSSRVMNSFLLFLGSLALFVLYLWIYTSVLGWETPKTAFLKKINAGWSSRIELMNRRMDRYDAVLQTLASRDEDVYRSLFGMNSIPDEVRNAGFGGVNRYAYLDKLDRGSLLSGTTRRLDVLAKKACVQSRSFDDVAALSKRAGDMVSCVPAIPPVNPDKNKYHLSSPFGFRADPVYGYNRMHTGIDFAMPSGSPVYASGDGVVSEVKYEFFGYGNSLVIDHGFGYKTRYAHMKTISVVEGMKVKRGDQVGESGRSGKATGPHLHYEVLYRGNHVNPINYMDLSMDPKEYAAMVRKRQDESKAVLQPFSLRRR